jgi:transcriptional regulator with XRE-family HTH domain
MDSLTLLIEARTLAGSGRGKRLRQAAGLSQAELAAAVGVTNCCISHWENGKRRPRGDAAARYALALRDLAGQL